MKISFAPVAHAYARLAPRERLLLQAAATATAGTILFLVASTLQSTRESLQRRIDAKEQQLQEVHELAARYEALEQQTEVLTATYGDRPENFSLFSFLENIGTKTVTREKILAMSPSSKTIGDQFVEESVEMRLSAVSLESLVDLLYEIENARTPLRVTRLKMKKRHKDPHNFDVTLVISTILEA